MMMYIPLVFRRNRYRLVNEYPKVELFHARAQCINESGEVFKGRWCFIKNMFLIDILTTGFL